MSFCSSVSHGAARAVFLSLQIGLSGASLRAQTDPDQSFSQQPVTGLAVGEDNAAAMLKAARSILFSGNNPRNPQLVVLLDAATGYTRDIASSEELSFEQLVVARAVMEQTVLKHEIFELSSGNGVTGSLTSCITDLYEQIIPRLMNLRHSSTTNAELLRNELFRHYVSVIGTMRGASTGNRERLAELLIRSNDSDDGVPLCQIYCDVDTATLQDRSVSSRFISRHFERLAQSFKEQTTRLANPSRELCGVAGDLLRMHALVKRDLDYASERGELSIAQIDEYRRNVPALFIEPLVPHILQAWILGYRPRFPKIDSTIFDEHAYWKPMAVEQSRFIPNSYTRSVTELLSAWPEDRSILGNALFDQLDRQRESFGPAEVIGFQSVAFLPLVAPDPARKEYIIEALRLGLVDDAAQPYIGETSDRPTQVARILALCLISDHLYFATASNTTYNPELALSLLGELRDDIIPLEPYRSVLTPTQFLILELLRISRGGDIAASTPWLKVYDARTRESVASRARSILDKLIFCLYECQPVDVFQDQGLQRAVPIPTPREWGTGPIQPPAPGREREWIVSRTTMFRLADLLFEDFATRVHEQPNIQVLSSQLTKTADLIRRRGGTLDRDFSERTFRAADRIREMYRKPSEWALGSQPPHVFSNLTNAIRELIQTINIRNQVRGDADLVSSEVAVQYVEAVQRLCIAEFALRELLSERIEDRVAGGPIKRGIGSICEQLGFFERDPHLRDLIVTGDISTAHMELHKYIWELEQELEAITKRIGL